MKVLIDSNVPMYLIGSDNGMKLRARNAVERAVLEGHRLVTDAEVFQEILHRYVAIRRPEFVAPACDLLLGLSDEVLPVTGQDVLLARDIAAAAHWGMSARDALHLAIMRHGSIDTILSFDADFDGHGVQRWA